MFSAGSRGVVDLAAEAPKSGSPSDPLNRAQPSHVMAQEGGCCDGAWSGASVPIVNDPF